MFRFLHLADVHLGAVMGGDALALRLAQARRESWQAAVRAAVEHQVHAVLIAGDLLHGDSAVQREDILAVQEGLSRLHDANIAVCYARGNHDPADTCPLKLPDWVEVFDTRFARLCQIRDGEGHLVGAVAGAGFDTAAIPQDLAPAYPTRHRDLPTVGLMHTQLMEERGRGTDYAPTSLSHLAALDYDYWALGHIHGSREYNGTIRYCGSLMAVDSSETGPKGGFLVEVSPHAAPRVQFLPLARVQLEDFRLEGLARCQGPEDIVQAAAAQLDSCHSRAPLLARIRLEGEAACTELLTGPGSQSLLQSMARDIEERADAWQVELIPGQIAPVTQASSLMDRKDLLGELMTVTVEAQHGGASLAQLEKELERMGLAGCRNADPETRRSYVQNLLADVESSLIERMKKA